MPKILLIQKKGESHGNVVQEEAQKSQEKRVGAMQEAKFKEGLQKSDQKEERQKEKMTNPEI